MRALQGLVVLVITALGCSPPAERPGLALRLDPPALDVRIVRGVPVTQSYTVTWDDVDGGAVDVTDEAVFSVSPAYGRWSGPVLTVTGGAAGPTRLHASARGLGADADLTVRVADHRVDGGGVPADAPDRFAAATEDAALAPAIAYPSDGITPPLGFGALDVHWYDVAGADVFAITLRSEYVERTIYRAGSDEQFTAFRATEWSALGAPAPWTLTVSGMKRANPTHKGTAPPRRVTASDAPLEGSVYYWTTQPEPAIYRHDMAEPDRPPSSYFGDGPDAPKCVGCHVLSRDGTRMAFTRDSGLGPGTVVDVASRRVLVDYQRDPRPWTFATFTPDATKLITVTDGVMSLRHTEGGAVIAEIANPPGRIASHPELSPDGTRLIYVESAPTLHDFELYEGDLVARSFDGAGGFGPVERVVEHAPGMQNYYPSWSPDGAWIAFTRTDGSSYDNRSSQLWVAAADGTRPPIRLGGASPDGELGNSWPRWAPAAQTAGPDHEPLFYLTFSSMRPFGVRAAGGTQIWMAPFFPARAEAGGDPTGPAFRLPFQQLDTANHIAQWSETIPVPEP